MENNILKLTDPELGLLEYVVNQIGGNTTIADNMSLEEIDKSVLSTIYDKLVKLKDF